MIRGRSLNAVLENELILLSCVNRKTAIQECDKRNHSEHRAESVLEQNAKCDVRVQTLDETVQLSYSLFSISLSSRLETIYMYLSVLRLSYS